MVEQKSHRGTGNEAGEQEFVVTLTALVYGGEAIGRLPDGRAVFVPAAIPGEQVRVRLVEDKRGYARASLLEVLVPSPDRIKPLCRHFSTCGGCHYQHMPYPVQLAAKRDILRDQLNRIGGLPDPPVNPVVPSAEAWDYRNTIQFHISPEGRLGFMASQSAGVLPVSECHLPSHPLHRIWEQLEIEAIPGLKRVSLRQGEDGEVLIILEGEDPTPPQVTVEELPVSIVYLGPAGKIVIAGNDYVVMEVLGRPFRVSAASFFQVNLPQAEAMVEHLLGLLPFKKGSTLLEAYCGVGLFSAFLAPRVQRLIGIESSPSAVEDFEVNLDEYDNVELYAANVEEVLQELDQNAELVVADPPRNGLERLALDGILKLRPAHFAYISCDPATLARDARRLVAGGYRLVQVTPFDMFPQTYHIESISLWENNRIAP